MTNLLYTGNNKKGFTLIEIMVVLTIMVLSLSIAVPAIWRSLGKTKVKTNVREMAATLRFARSRAISTKKTVRVVVDIDKDTYVVKEISSKLKKDDELDTSETNDTSAFPDEDPDRQASPTNIVGFRTAPDENMQESGKVTIHFYPLGNSDGGEFVVSGLRQNHNYLIRIDSISGRVHIEDAHSMY